MTLSPPHIVHVSSAHPWTDNRIHYREAASLATAGYKVSLVASESSVTGAQPDVEVVVLPKLSRVKRVVLGGPRAITAALRTGARVFHLHDPELLWAVPLLRLAGRKVIYDAHEDLPIQVIDKPYATAITRPLLKVAANFLVVLARSSNCIIAATEPIADRFPAGRTTVVRNYPPLRAEEATSPPVGMRSPAVVYVGAIASTRGAQEMVRMLSEEAFPEDWRLTLAGSGASSLIDELRSLPGWQRTEYIGQVSPVDARNVILQSRVGLVILQRTEAYVQSLPTKMFEYFAAGVPVIASDFPLWREIIERFQCGLLVDERDPAAIARAVALYASDPELLERHSRSARRAATETFHWGHEATALIAAYNKIVPLDKTQAPDA